MDIALMNEKVMFQKNAVVTDQIGNHRNVWEDYYACFATIIGEGAKEKETAATVVEDATMNVTIRYCTKAASISSITHRLVFRGELYDITNVDHMSYKKKCLKLSCRKVRR